MPNPYQDVGAGWMDSNVGRWMFGKQKPAQPVKKATKLARKRQRLARKKNRK